MKREFKEEMNFIHSFFTIITLSVGACEINYTNDVIFSVIERLKIQKCILVSDDLLSDPRKFADNLKYFSRERIYTSVVDSKRIIPDIFSKVESFDPRTLVVFQTKAFVKLLRSSDRPVSTFFLMALRFRIQIMFDVFTLS